VKANKAAEQRSLKQAAVGIRREKRRELQEKKKNDAIFNAQLQKTSLLSLKYDHANSTCES
jgi:hypothetical protein